MVIHLHNAYHGSPQRVTRLEFVAVSREHLTHSILQRHMHHSRGAEWCRTPVYNTKCCLFSSDHVFCWSLMAAAFCAVRILRASGPPSGHKDGIILRDVVHGNAFSQRQATWRCFICTSSQRRKMTIKKLIFGGGLQVWLRSRKLLQPFLSRVFHDGAGSVVLKTSELFESKIYITVSISERYR